ncbi:MAG: hypothetical protein E6K72_01220 [Candidatus Eisenbacteria bacterium]|uniref:Uncharacterized protein n=1 Tax=Eiseniibacteriota bacterium TaxID=2212470 RepID=A0A538T8N5_UNCEI|nr:MAG: hypothetical protein E6K72_01220 [Candidatus Eisenbacteria bacterium]
MNLLVPLLVVLVISVLLRLLVPVTIRITTNVSVRDLRALSAAFDARMVPYMQGSYSGDPTNLEGAMRGLLAIAREVAAQQPERVGEDILHTLIVTAVAARRIARRDRARAALDAVLRAERKAA